MTPRIVLPADKVDVFHANLIKHDENALVSWQSYQPKRGETLVNETTEYQTWADWLDVPRHTFSAMFGAVIIIIMILRPQGLIPSRRRAMELKDREKEVAPQ